MLRSINIGHASVELTIDDHTNLVTVSHNNTEIIYSVNSNGTLRLFSNRKHIEKAQNNRLY